VWLRIARAEIGAHDLAEQAITADLFEAELDERAGRLDEALARVEDALQRDIEDESRAQFHRAATGLYAALSRFDQAVAAGRAALEIEEGLHGGDHPHVASSLMVLGDVLEGAGRVQEGYEAVARSLAIRERVASDRDRLQIENTRLEAAVALVGLGRKDEGIEMLRQAVAALREIGEKQSLAIGLNQLGWAHAEVHDASQARDAYAESVAIMRALYPDGHPSLAVAISNLASQEDRLHNEDAAIALFEDAIAMRRAVVKGYDPQLAFLLLNYARPLSGKGRKDEALATLREARSMTMAEPMGAGAVQIYRTLLRLVEPEKRDELRAEARERCDALDPAPRRASGCAALQVE
jgi:serine/threonine-protein kinase